jgi:hypothetical protein
MSVEDIYEILKAEYLHLSDAVLMEWAGKIADPTTGYTLENSTSLDLGEIVATPDPIDASVVPPAFEEAITQSEGWFNTVTTHGMDADEQDALLRRMYDKFVNGFDPDEENPAGWQPGGTVEDFMGQGSSAPGMPDPKDATAGIYASAESYFEASPEGYKPNSGTLPEGWLTFWGDDYTGSTNEPVIKDWLDMWVERFNSNNESTSPYAEHLLIDDFYNDSTDGLYSQDWWTDKTNNFLAMTEMWYTQGGPGGADGSGILHPGDEGVGQTTYGGVGNWGKIWSDSIEIIRSTADDLGIEDELTDTMVSQIAFTLMSEGGAAAHLEPQTAEGWPNQARQMTENILIQSIRSGGFVQPLGAGEVTDIEKRLRSYADMQMIDLDQMAALNNTTVRDWALDIKSEQGDNEGQVMTNIATKAHQQWGLTPEEIDSMGQAGAEGSGTITNLIGDLYAGATSIWGDTSYRKNDPWLMDNYQIEDPELGRKRFRTQTEMKAAARQNMDRFSEGKSYQNPMNQFIAGAASMFRSDYR